MDFSWLSMVGLRGIQDVTVLESGLALPRQKYIYAKPDLFDLAAAHAAAIIRNHPFIDGNKRTGFALQHRGHSRVGALHASEEPAHRRIRTPGSVVTH